MIKNIVHFFVFIFLLGTATYSWSEEILELVIFPKINKSIDAIEDYRLNKRSEVLSSKLPFDLEHDIQKLSCPAIQIIDKDFLDKVFERLSFDSYPDSSVKRFFESKGNAVLFTKIEWHSENCYKIRAKIVDKNATVIQEDEAILPYNDSELKKYEKECDRIALNIVSRYCKPEGLISKCIPYISGTLMLTSVGVFVHSYLDYRPKYKDYENATTIDDAIFYRDELETAESQLRTLRNITIGTTLFFSGVILWKQVFKKDKQVRLSYTSKSNTENLTILLCPGYASKTYKCTLSIHF